MPASLLEDPPQSPANTQAAAKRLRATFVATKVSFTWFGVRKTLSAAQTAQAAEGFDADGKALSATKKLLDTRHPQFQAVTAVRGRLLQYWKGLTLPYPEPGLRLIRQTDVNAFHEQLQQFQIELIAAVEDLDRHFSELRDAARQRLGQLFNPADYPASLADEFGVTWEFPAVEPPNYLRAVHPQLYEQECQRVQARFSEAVELAEQAFLTEFAQLVSHLTDRLAGGDDGRPKVFRDSAVENLSTFFERFRRLTLQSDEQLDELVGQAQRILRGVAPQELRTSGSLRQVVATQMAGVQATLDQLLVDRPRRTLLRSPRPETV